MISDTEAPDFSRRAWFEAEQNRILFENLGASLLATVFLSVGLVFVQWGHIATPLLVGWLVSMLGIVAVRGWLAYRYRIVAPAEADARQWLLRFQIGATAAGLAWGSAGILLFPQDDLAHQVFLGFVLAGVASGGVTSMSASWSTVRLFLLFTLLPLTVMLLRTGSGITVVMGAMSGLFGFVVLTNALRFYRNTEENLLLHHEAAERERELRIAEERNRLLLNSAADGIFGLDNDARVDFANPSAAAMLASPVESLIGRDFREVTGYCDVGGQAGREVHREIAAVVRDGIPRAGGDTFFRRADGTAFPVQFDSRPLRLEDRLAGGVVTVRDISEQKRTEEILIEARQAAEAASESKSRFLATVSHEIRTPLHGILGMADLLLDSPLESDQREHVGIIQESGRTLLSIIDDILDFSRAEAGRLELQDSVFDLAGVVYGVARLCAARVGDRDLQVLVQFSGHCPSHCRGDPKRFQQVLVNLVGNAVKFTEAGYVLIEVRPGGQRDKDIVISVSDSGVGIPEEAIANLFTPFSQVDASNTRSFGGTGLGLAISKQLVELMGGTIEVDSEPGRGSEFVLYLPLMCEYRTRVDPRPPLASYRAVVIDTQSVAAQVARAMLCAMGAEVLDHDADPATLLAGGYSGLVVVASDGIAKHLPWLLMLDARVRVLVVGHGAARDLPPALEDRPGCAFLRKPFAPEQWLAALDLEARKTSEKSSRESPPYSGPVGGQILVAEDNKVNQRVVASLLRRHGYAYDIAENGLMALDAWRSSHYDLILMDCQMPLMDGFDATITIRAEESGSRTPIIALTANAFGSARERCLKAGMDDFISKPFSAQTLLTTLQRWICVDSPALEMPAPAPIEAVPPASAIHEPTFRELQEILEDEFDELLETFVAETDELIGQVEQAAVSAIAEARRAAHSIKSASANLGANTLSELAKVIEHAAADGSLGERGELIAPLREEFDRVREWLVLHRQA